MPGAQIQTGQTGTAFTRCYVFHVKMLVISSVQNIQQHFEKTSHTKHTTEQHPPGKGKESGGICSVQPVCRAAVLPMRPLNSSFTLQHSLFVLLQCD